VHDPMVVAFEIPNPWPKRQRWREKVDAKRYGRWGLYRQRRTNAANLGEPVYRWWRPKGWTLRLAGRNYGMRHLVTVWHVEPGGRDSGTVCRHHIRGDTWRAMPRWRARLDPFIKPLDDGRWAADRSWKWHVWHWHLQIHPLQDLRARLFDRCALCGRRGRPNISHQWDGPGIGWRKWRSRPGLYHRECSALGHLRREQATDEDLIRYLVAALRVEWDLDEPATLARLTDARTRSIDFAHGYRLTRLLGYQRDDNHQLVKQQRTPTR
jgi:hypothetical protein